VRVRRPDGNPKGSLQKFSLFDGEKPVDPSGEGVLQKGVSLKSCSGNPGKAWKFEPKTSNCQTTGRYATKTFRGQNCLVPKAGSQQEGLARLRTGETFVFLAMDQRRHRGGTGLTFRYLRKGFFRGLVGPRGALRLKALRRACGSKRHSGSLGRVGKAAPGGKKWGGGKCHPPNCPMDRRDMY